METSRTSSRFEALTKGVGHSESVAEVATQRSCVSLPICTTSDPGWLSYADTSSSSIPTILFSSLSISAQMLITTVMHPSLCPIGLLYFEELLTDNLCGWKR